MNYRQITHLSPSSVFISSQKKGWDKGLQKKEKQRFMYTGKSISSTSETSFDNLSYFLCVVYNFYVCMKMTAYSPSFHFLSSKQWEYPCFEWGNRNFTFP